MRWEIESWRKLYVHCSPGWLALPALARGLGSELIKYCDDKGQIPLGPSEEPWQTVCRVLAAHRGEHKAIKRLVASLTQDGFLVVCPLAFVSSSSDVPSALTGRSPGAPSPLDGSSSVVEAIVLRNFVDAQKRTTNAERQAKHRKKLNELQGVRPKDPVTKVVTRNGPRNGYEVTDPEIDLEIENDSIKNPSDSLSEKGSRTPPSVDGSVEVPGLEIATDALPASPVPEPTPKPSAESRTVALFPDEPGPTERKPAASNIEQEIFDVWLEGWKTHVHHGSTPKLSPKYLRALRNALRDGQSPQDLKDASRGIWNDLWANGTTRKAAEFVYAMAHADQYRAVGANGNGSPKSAPYHKVSTLQAPWRRPPDRDEDEAS